MKFCLDDYIILIIRLGYPVVKFCLDDYSMFCALQLLKNWLLAHGYNKKVKIVLFIFNVATNKVYFLAVDLFSLRFTLLFVSLIN